MPQHTIDDLRAHLFEALAGLKDREKPLDIERAKAIADIGKVIVESAKVEVAFLNVTGAAKSTGFLPDADARHGRPTPPAAPRLNGSSTRQ